MRTAGTSALAVQNQSAMATKKGWMRDGEGQFSDAFVTLGLDVANEIEGDFGFVMAYSDPDHSDGRRSAEWLARITGCMDPAAI